MRWLPIESRGMTFTGEAATPDHDHMSALRPQANQIAGRVSKAGNRRVKPQLWAVGKGAGRFFQRGGEASRRR
jgi:hypothetical protein